MKNYPKCELVRWTVREAKPDEDNSVEWESTGMFESKLTVVLKPELFARVSVAGGFPHILPAVKA